MLDLDKRFTSVHLLFCPSVRHVVALWQLVHFNYHLVGMLFEFFRALSASQNFEEIEKQDAVSVIWSWTRFPDFEDDVRCPLFAACTTSLEQFCRDASHPGARGGRSREIALFTSPDVDGY